MSNTGWKLALVHKAAGLAPGAMLALTLMSVGTTAFAKSRIIVTSTDDTRVTGKCTLRDAFNVVLGNSISPAVCNAEGSGPPYTIAFGGGLTGVISLQSTLPKLRSGTDLTIIGPADAPGITIDGGGNVELILVDADATLNLKNLTLAKGHVDCTGKSCSAVGGAIDNEGTLNIADCTFSDNRATCSGNPCDADGGAILNDGILTITNSTFVHNVATGGANGAGGGGAIRNISYAMLTITNATFFENLASGRMGADGAAIHNAVGGVIDLKGTILANSTGPNCFPTPPKITDDGYNLSDDKSCSFTAKGSQNDVKNIGLAGGPARNGGPTETVALLPNNNSPAIDKIPHDLCTYTGTLDPCKTTSPEHLLLCDQRGKPRPDPEDGPNGNCDIGAYESQ